MSVNNYFSQLFSLVAAISTLALPLIAQGTSRSADPTSYGMTSGRLVATLAAVVALIGVVIGGLALARRVGRPGAFVAFVSGLLGAVVGGWRVATAGGIGTGGGRAGAIVALILGLIAMVLAGLTLARSRDTEAAKEVTP